jgi:hypothetical protein
VGNYSSQRRAGLDKNFVLTPAGKELIEKEKSDVNFFEKLLFFS